MLDKKLYNIYNLQPITKLYVNTKRKRTTTNSHSQRPQRIQYENSFDSRRSEPVAQVVDLQALLEHVQAARPTKDKPPTRRNKR